MRQPYAMDSPPAHPGTASGTCKSDSTSKEGVAGLRGATGQPDRHPLFRRAEERRRSCVKGRKNWLNEAHSMNCVNGNFDSTFPLTPSLSLGERVNHLAPLVDTSRATDVKPSRQMLLPLP